MKAEKKEKRQTYLFQNYKSIQAKYFVFFNICINTTKIYGANDEEKD